jgi:hypothetical protein
MCRVGIGAHGGVKIRSLVWCNRPSPGKERGRYGASQKNERYLLTHHQTLSYILLIPSSNLMIIVSLDVQTEVLQMFFEHQKK